uniref:Nucleoporin NUP35 n=1 Tax=Sinocyclocheilus grahami TaxID=75366 RepID=A0A672Q5P9_SINGR
PTPKDKSGAPPVRSIYDDLNGSCVGMSPLAARKQPFAGVHTPLSGLPGTPGTVSNLFSPVGQQRKTTLSPAQVDPFFTQGDALSSEDQLDDTWVTVFGFPPASASYILLQFAQYGNILKHVMSNSGNWMHIQYQSKLQARKALSNCIVASIEEKGALLYHINSKISEMDSSPKNENYPMIPPLSHPRYQQTPKKDESFVSKAVEYMFGW